VDTQLAAMKQEMLVSGAGLKAKALLHERSVDEPYQRG